MNSISDSIVMKMLISLKVRDSFAVPTHATIPFWNSRFRPGASGNTSHDIFDNNPTPGPDCVESLCTNGQMRKPNRFVQFNTLLVGEASPSRMEWCSFDWIDSVGRPAAAHTARLVMSVLHLRRHRQIDYWMLWMQHWHSVLNTVPGFLALTNLQWVAHYTEFNFVKSSFLPP